MVTNTLYHGVYFGELLSQVARMTEDRGRQLILADGKHSADEERQAIQYLLDSRCDGVIIYPRFLGVEEMDEIIEQHEQPIMVLNRRLSRHPAHCVYADQQAAAEAVVDKLVAMGHREIAFIAGSADSPTGAERLAGYRQALIRHGIPVQETLIAPGKWTPACGAAAVSALLARGARFSALVASNDDMAIGAIKRLHEAGVMVPDEVSVVGFDDIPLAPYVIPALSSVKMPVNGMIQETINRLITMVEEGSRDALPAFSGTLIRRDSLRRLTG